MPGKGKLILGFIICFLLFIWASAYTAIYVGLDSFKPESLALLRFIIAFLCLLGYGLFKGVSWPRIKDIPIILICGFLGISVYHVALNYGEITVSPGSASMILNAYPIFVAILSSLVLKEYVNITKWIGILVSFAGIAFIAVGEAGGFGLSPGALLILISAISLSLFDVAQKKLLNRYTPLELTLYFFGTGTLFLMLFSGSLIQDLKTASMASTMSVAYLGIIPGAVSYLIWSKLISKHPISTLSTVLYLVPPVTILIAFIYLGQIPTMISLIGGTVALLGVVIVNFADKLQDLLPGNEFKKDAKVLIRK